MFGSHEPQTKSLVETPVAPPILRVAPDTCPLAEVAPGRMNCVFSPHVAGHQLVNVEGFAPGAQVRCPYTDKTFLVPDFKTLRISPAALSYTEVPLRNFALAEAFTKIPYRPQKLKDSDPVAIIKRLGLDVFALDPAIPSTNMGPLGSLPFAQNVPGQPGMVYSPFARHSQLVDVAGLMPGVEVTCPYSGQIFRVPAPLPITASIH